MGPGVLGPVAVAQLRGAHLMPPRAQSCCGSGRLGGCGCAGRCCGVTSKGVPATAIAFGFPWPRGDGWGWDIGVLLRKGSAEKSGSWTSGDAQGG